MRMNDEGAAQTDLGVKIFAKIQPKEKDDDVKDVANFRPWPSYDKKGAVIQFPN